MAPRWCGGRARLGSTDDAGVDEAAVEAGCRVGVAHLVVVHRAGEDGGVRCATLVARLRCGGAEAIEGIHVAGKAGCHDESEEWD